jgi:hypothetical protein
MRLSAIAFGAALLITPAMGASTSASSDSCYYYRGHHYCIATTATTIGTGGTGTTTIIATVASEAGATAEHQRFATLANHFNAVSAIFSQPDSSMSQ